MPSTNPNLNIELWTRIQQRYHKSSKPGLVYLYAPYSMIAKPSSPCWIWTGWMRKGNYGYIEYRGKKYTVSRLMWEIFVGRIPPRWEIDHLCLNHSCINPDHLEIVPAIENRRRQALHARKDICPQGHPLSDANVAMFRGWRACRTCTNASKRRRYYKKHEEYKAASRARYAKRLRKEDT